MRRHWGQVVFFLIGLCLAAAPCASAEEQAKLKVFASRHYHIHTDLSRQETIPYGRHMDAVFTQYERRFASYSQRENDKPMSLYLFRNQSSYMAFLKKHGISAEGSGGMFFITHRLQGLATWTAGHSKAQTLRTLQHEGFHQFSWHYIGPKLPTWMNEGLAQYFEDAVILENGMELGLADPQRMKRVRMAVKNNWAISIDQLMSLTGKDWSHSLRTNASRSELLYAQSWSVVYFMIHGDNARYLRPFEVYLRQLSEGATHEEAFHTGFGAGATKALEDRWRRFALQQEPNPVYLAADRLGFLAAAMVFKSERNEAMPRDYKTFRRDLFRRGFTLTRTASGVTEELRADDVSMFTYTRPGGEVSDFLLLEPERRGLPPRLTAPGLSPEPTLVWDRDADGELVHEIRYR